MNHEARLNGTMYLLNDCFDDWLRSRLRRFTTSVGATLVLAAVRGEMWAE